MTDWRTEYEQKKRDYKNALRSIKPGNRVFIGSGCGEPQYLVDKLDELRWELSDIEIVHGLSIGKSSYTNPEFKGHFRLKTFYIASGSREAVSEGRADYTPIYLRDIPALFQSGRLPIHVALIQVSPPDVHGYCSLGVSVDITKVAAQNARMVVAQVNPMMPRVWGDSFIHVSELDVIVEQEAPLLEFHLGSSTKVHHAIGERIAKLVEDGSTVHAGIGMASATALRHLVDKKDLGIHTDVLFEPFLDLVHAGAVTNRKKRNHQGKIIASLAIGARRMYDFVHDNPMVEFHPTQYVNDPSVIASNDRMVSINPAIQIDLTGQICADSLGHQILSGIGGYVDFMMGTRMSKEGKHIVALPSTSLDGKRSRIVTHLDEGSGVIITRASVQYIVTEYGVAHLHGLTIRERALALISIAHPRFREQLLEDAKNLKYVYEDQIIQTGEGGMYPDHLEIWQTFKDNQQYFFRPIKPTDERALQEFFYSLPKEDIYYRFLSNMKVFSHYDTQSMCNIDYQNEMAIVGCTGSQVGDQIIAMGRYIVEPKSDMAEVDFTVSHELQRHGIGTFLLHYLTEVARENGVKGFTAYVLSSNRKMLSVFHRTGYRINTRMDDGVFRIWFRFDEKVDQCLLEPEES